MARDPEVKGPEPTWDRLILDRWPSGIDTTQIEERLRLSPTERLERMRQFLEFIEEARGSGGRRLQTSD